MRVSFRCNMGVPVIASRTVVVRAVPRGGVVKGARNRVVCVRFRLRFVEFRWRNDGASFFQFSDLWYFRRILRYRPNVRCVFRGRRYAALGVVVRACRLFCLSYEEDSYVENRFRREGFAKGNGIARRINDGRRYTIRCAWGRKVDSFWVPVGLAHCPYRFFWSPFFEGREDRAFVFSLGNVRGHCFVGLLRGWRFCSGCQDVRVASFYG